MGIFDTFESWKYGQKVEIRDFERMLAERGLSLADVHLPNLLGQGDARNEGNPYRSPGTGHRKIPKSEIYQYFRVRGEGDNVEYFAQRVADTKDKQGVWRPGPVVHAPIKLPKKSKSKK